MYLNSSVGWVVKWNKMNAVYENGSLLRTLNNGMDFTIKTVPPLMVFDMDFLMIFVDKRLIISAFLCTFVVTKVTITTVIITTALTSRIYRIKPHLVIGVISIFCLFLFIVVEFSYVDAQFE